MNNTIIPKLSFNSLENKLANVQSYVLRRYDYYNDEKQAYNFVKGSNFVNSDAIKITIDDLRNRLLINHFINNEDYQSYLTKNFMNKIIKSALITGCAFARVIKQPNGQIELIPYDAYFCTGKLNNDNTLDEAISIDATDSVGFPRIVTYYSKKKIRIVNIKNKTEIVTKNKLGIIPIIPVIFNQNALKPFGSSFITKKMMKDTDSLIRTKKRLDVNEQVLTEASAFLLGVSGDLKTELTPEELEKVKNIVMISSDADMQSPSLATRDTGNNDLAIKIVNLEKSIKYDTTTTDYLNMVASIRQDLIDAINLICNTILRVKNDDVNAKLDEEIDIVFKNVDYSNLSALMDGVLKVNQVVPNYWGKEQLDKILGVNGNKSPLLDQIDNEVT